MEKRFKIGDQLRLKEDKKREKYFVIDLPGTISRGPMRQWDPSEIVIVNDEKGRRWDFRADTLCEFKANKEDYEQTTKEVLAEVLRAKTMFPVDFVNQHEGYAVILEEIDELWDEVKKNQRNYDLAAMRKEAIQCAAMCIRFATELTPNP